MVHKFIQNTSFLEKQTNSPILCIVNLIIIKHFQLQFRFLFTYTCLQGMEVFSSGSLNDDMEHLGVWEGFSARGKGGRKTIAEEKEDNDIQDFVVCGLH